MKRGKKYVEAAKAVDRATLYDAPEAISLVKKAAVAKFDETIEVHIRTADSTGKPWFCYGGVPDTSNSR